jgi:NADPH2:quinone reductase
LKAILVEKLGGPEVLKLKDVSTPEPGPGQVLVKIKAIGVNFVDVYQRRGEFPAPLPFIPGMEGSGIVERVGPNVTNVKAGDRVAYTMTPGAYAEYGLVPSDFLIKFPEKVSFELGAAFINQGMTAHYLVNESCRINPGDHVLIHAAAGGVGLILVQWAKHLGAKVIGTVSTQQKADAIREAGADHAIIYSEHNFVEETRRIVGEHGVDLIFDGVGKTTVPGDIQLAARRGTIALFGWSSGWSDPIAPNQLMFKSINLWGGNMQNYVTNGEEFAQRASSVLDGLTEGWLNFRIQENLPLTDAPQAHTLLEDRKSIGKVLLHTSS